MRGATNAARAPSGCRDCAADLEHCHGVAILHLDEVPDCTEGPCCSLPAELHAAVVPCVEVSCNCVLILDGVGGR